MVHQEKRAKTVGKHGEGVITVPVTGVMCAACVTLSSVTVVINALRLRRVEVGRNGRGSMERDVEDTP